MLDFFYLVYCYASCPLSCFSSPWLPQAASSGNSSLPLRDASSRGFMEVKQLSLAEGPPLGAVSHYFIDFFKFL